MKTSKDSRLSKLKIANKDLRLLNNVGARIKWCREQLKLSQREVGDACGMPKVTYASREYGVRSYYHEEYLALAEFFNSQWKKKFGQSFPSFEGQEIVLIDVTWLMFGKLV